jgi:hypothetical protein
MIRQQLVEILESLERLASSGNVRTDGEGRVSDLRVSVAQLIEVAEQANQAAAAAVPDPVDIRLSDLVTKVEVLSDQFAGVVDLVGQLSKLAGDLQSAVVKG